jgi:hypothetical protein
MGKAKSTLFEVPHKLRDYKANQKMVGAMVPRPIFDEFSLLALYHNTSKSDLILEMIERRIREDEPVEAIVRILGNRVYQDWERRKARNEGKHPQWKNFVLVQKRLEDFKEEVRMRLRRRKICEHHINAIIDEFRRLKGEDIDG